MIVVHRPRDHTAAHHDHDLAACQEGEATTVPSFDDLVAEGAAVDVQGWDFSWFEGRANEARPPWGYARMLGERMAALAGVAAAAALDLQTGGGEVLATIPAAPPTLVATESWPPNLAVARRNLAALGAEVVWMADERDDLPFADATFDLVVSRHPVGVRWDEIARVLKPGGTYLSQDVGDGSVAELTRPDGVRRRWRRGSLPAEGHLDRAGLHGSGVPRPASRSARANRGGRPIRRNDRAIPHRGPQTVA